MISLKKIARYGLPALILQLTVSLSSGVYADDLLMNIRDLAHEGKVLGSAKGLDDDIDTIRNQFGLPSETGSDYMLYKLEHLRFSYNEAKIVTRINNEDPALLNQITPAILRESFGKYIPVAQYEKGTYCTTYSYVSPERPMACFFHPWGFTYHYLSGDYILVFNFKSADKKYHDDIHPDKYYIFKFK